MPRFKYRIKDTTGNTLEGIIEADDQRAAASSLLAAGNYVLSLQEEHAGPVHTEGFGPLFAFRRWVVYPLIGGATVASLAFFFRQLATMIKSGIPVVQALSMLSERAPGSRLRQIARDAAETLQHNGTLSEAFSRYPWVFSDLQVAMLRAGESGGKLDVMAERIADYLDREHSLRQRLRIATLYPKILVLAVIFIPAIPKLVLEGFPAYWDATVEKMLPVLAILLGIWALYRILCQIRIFRYAIDAVKLVIPGIGKVVRASSLSRFYRALAALLSAGVPLSDALRQSANASGSGFYSTRLKESVPLVEAGYSLTESLRYTRAIPRLSLDMVATGEQTGNVDGMLDKAAEYAESEAEVAATQGTAILGVLLFLMAAAYIGFFIVRSYAGYYAGILNSIDAE